MVTNTVADPRAQTYYTDDSSLVVRYAAPGGATEAISFEGGSVVTSDPGRTTILDRYVALGLVSRTPPKKAGK